MKKPLWTLCAAILLTTVPLGGEVGQLQYTKLDTGRMRTKSLSRRYLHTHAVTPPAAGCGTVHPKARAAKLGKGPTAIWVAFDAAKADAGELDLARFDFSGKGKFDGKHTLPMKKTTAGSQKRYTIGPGTLRVPREGATVSVRISGTLRDRGEAGYCLLVYPTVAAQGSCKFGEKVYGVLVIDGNGNFHLGDGPKVTPVQRDGKDPLRHRAGGDVMLIDTSGPTFAKAAIEVPCGQRIRIGETWYEPSFSPCDLKVTAAEVSVKTGKVLVPHHGWSMTLIGTKHILFDLKGKGGEAVSVPADSYVAANYRIDMPAAGSSRAPYLMAGRNVLTGAAAVPFDVAVGKTTKLTLGAPLTVGVKVAQSKGSVSFNAQVTDANSAVVNSFTGPGGKRPQPPTVVVDDAKGKEIYRGKMKFG